MTATAAEVSKFSSNDMALVTYIRLTHGAPSDYYMESKDVVFWDFDDTPELRAVVDAFHNGKARVEPRQYDRAFKQTKREMYSLVDNARD